MTKREHNLVEIGRKWPASVLLAIVEEQAANSVFSEAECRRLETAYRNAAETARLRRIWAESYCGDSENE